MGVRRLLVIAHGLLGRRETLSRHKPLVSLLVHPLANAVADRDDDRLTAHTAAYILL
jgi:hypothetical protein